MVVETINEIEKDGIVYIVTTGTDDETGDIVYYVEYPKPSGEYIEPLGEAEQASITAALNTEYLVCLSELNM